MEEQYEISFWKELWHWKIIRWIMYVGIINVLINTFGGWLLEGEITTIRWWLNGATVGLMFLTLLSYIFLCFFLMFEDLFEGFLTIVVTPVVMHVEGKLPEKSKEQEEDEEQRYDMNRYMIFQALLFSIIGIGLLIIAWFIGKLLQTLKPGYSIPGFFEKKKMSLPS